MNTTRARPRKTFLISALLTLIAAVTAYTRAAPLFPRSEVTNEMQSLAGVTTVLLEVNPLPEEIEDAGITTVVLRREIRKQLTENGCVLAKHQGDTAFQLRMTVVHCVNERVPDAIGIAIFLALEQPTSIDRLEKTLLIPTWTSAAVDVFHRDDTADSIRLNVDIVLADFFRKRKLATQTNR